MKVLMEYINVQQLVILQCGLGCVCFTPCLPWRRLHQPWPRCPYWAGLQSIYVITYVLMDPMAGSLAAAIVLFLHKWSFSELNIWIYLVTKMNIAIVVRAGDSQCSLRNRRGETSRNILKWNQNLQKYLPIIFCLYLQNALSLPRIIFFLAVSHFKMAVVIVL